MMYKLIKVSEADARKRLDLFLSASMPEISRSQIQRLIEDRKIKVNDQFVKASFRLEPEDKIVIEIPPAKTIEIDAEDIDLDIIYEDPDLIVVNKPKGMVVHPAAGHYKGTLVNALLHHCDDLSGINGVLRPGIVHRIDKDTSGLLLAAKNDFAHQSLARQIKEHSVQRIYIALVKGVIPEPGGTIEAPIGRSLSDRQKMAVLTRNSKEALTEYRVLERLEGYTLIKCRLKTGRTHQIRVHMAYIGHPVVGDKKYGAQKDRFDIKGQALHAMTIGFLHPRYKEWLEFEVEPPAYFMELLNELGSKTENVLGGAKDEWGKQSSNIG